MDFLCEDIVPLEVLLPLMQEYLNAGRNVQLSPRGISMLPMLRQGRDTVVLSPVNGTLKKFDLPLYRRKDGTFILHRVIAVGKTYTCMGDHQFVPERNVEQEQIIAVVTGFYRDDRYYSVEDLRYRLYCRFWYDSRWLRRICHRGVAFLRRLGK